jgi:hypothetical protein
MLVVLTNTGTKSKVMITLLSNKEIKKVVTAIQTNAAQKQIRNCINFQQRL